MIEQEIPNVVQQFFSVIVITIVRKLRKVPKIKFEIASEGAGLRT